MFFYVVELEIGKKVKFINENLQGEIITIISKGRLLISCSDGFDREVSINEIVIVGENNQLIYEVGEFETVQGKKVSNKKETEKKNVLFRYLDSKKYKYEGVLEIDLHLEKLVEFPGNLEDWQRLHTQMQHVKNCLGAAMNKNIKRIVFIHGVGTGVLKTELHNYLSNYENLVIEAADFREYGEGATEIFIKNS